jgi:transcriptional regulator with XRE-family HTH domain
LDFAALVRSRLDSLGYEQKDLARAAQVTDSYISQLLKRRKAPPSQNRTDIYGRMEAFLDLRPGELTRLSEIERVDEFKRRIGQATQPLFPEFRELVLRKCVPAKRDEVRAIFERAALETLERLIARKLLDLAQSIARRELDSDDWLRVAARVGGRSREEMRIIVLEFLDTDVFQVSNENCVAFLDPLLQSWDIDLINFNLTINLNPDLVNQPRRAFAFAEDPGLTEAHKESGLTEFLNDRALCGDITEEEIRLLRWQRFGEKRPTKLYYYRALQNLRDSIHFRPD